MSKKTNLKNQEKIKLYLLKNDLQPNNTTGKSNNNGTPAGTKLLQGTGNGLPNR